MRVACLGGGPAGIYFAISMKLRDPSHEVHVFERNRAGDTFGWGVVFSDQTLGNLTRNDPVSAETIMSSFAHWDDIEVAIDGASERSSGHGFIGIGRLKLLQILQARARELGVIMHFEHEFSADLTFFADYDLIVAADGVNSRIRTQYEDRFDVDIQTRANKFIWLGTTKQFDAFTFAFEQTEAGWIWAHAYRFDETHSTFIVECSPQTWEALGLEHLDQAETIALCERIFARHLDGHALLTNASHLRGSAAWINFRRVICGRWSFDNVVLLGDAAHTAHFSIGSGTKLALEDAIKLAEVLSRSGLEGRDDLTRALAEYQDERQVEVLKIQNSARNSTEWFETLERYAGFDPRQFAYSLLTRSQRVSHENLRQRDEAWLSKIEQWFADEADNDDVAPPLLTPFTVGGLTLSNRVVVPPMLVYAAQDDGAATDFHLTHYGARVLGGAGLVMTETLAVSPEGRMTPTCPGLYDDVQIDVWTRINTLARSHDGAATCAQIGHAGPRGSCQPPDARGRIDVPLAQPWPVVAASDRPWRDGGLTPQPLDEAGMARILDDFVAATRRADAAGFDMLEVHAGHGGLLSSFITPLMNHRTDAYGGDLDNRLRFPLAVVAAVRAVWPAAKPLAVRLSATDWAGEAGVTITEAVEIARRLKTAGADLIDVSAGETDPKARPVYGRMFQTPMADQIRNEAGVPVIAVGNITEADQANSILAAGRADLVALGRPHLADPVWTLRAAAQAGRAISTPAAYRSGQDQLIRQFQKQAEMARG
ncbi:bifunctional salicylyl-CoA 5-hydroxylase/oxidoreductase [Brevundimonas nasdae]|uniref:bifunctional salicylyl-CoA 5-hydroxylase/oxidoreductase n=1 Tax=Brevundimonas nasdae TaxID=172043 RepID=UPI0019118D21|nr:bifunctional salicylyl-CoA 5-hydroxylase/oxidoreductase [Brevundimonas nasdae]MBK6026867.1 bifunctional salicylyl-CoA 5-hydroxylase/oxidoreductase [Brevundimonas nasdae]